MISAFSQRIYEGWKVHAGMFICAMFASGCTTYIFGLFVVPVSEEFGISRANLNLGFVAFLLGNALLSPLVGYLLDKLPARWVVCSGGFFFSFGMIVIATTDSLPLMLLMILLPISYTASACGTLGANTVVARWFKRQRGRALGTVAVATSLGGFLFTPLTALLIENFGWRQALVVMSVLANICIVLVTVFLVRNHPSGQERGYPREFNKDESTHAPEDRDQNKDQDKDDKAWTPGELMRNRNFWLLTVGISLLFAGDMALVASTVPHFQDAGIELTAAALVASFMTMSAIGGKLLVGYLADKIDLRLVFYAVASAHILMLVVFILMPPYWVLLVAATFCGIAVGGVFPVWATLIAWLFGSKSFGAIMGIMTIPLNLLGIAALRFVGEVYDATGSYAVGFMVFIATILLSMVMVTFIRPPGTTAAAADISDHYQSASPSPSD